MKLLPFLLLLTVNIFGQIHKGNTNIDSLKNLYRIKTNVINFIETEKYDSLENFIKYIDSTESKNQIFSSKERYFIELFIGRIIFISTPVNYKSYLGLRDTVDWYTPGAYKLLYHEPNIFDSSSAVLEVNLLDYFLLSFRSRLNTLQREYPGYDYIWDFLDFIYDKNMTSVDYVNNKASEYYKNYPNSPLLNFVRYNFLCKEKESKRGVKFGLGYGWFGFDKDTRNLFSPRGNLTIWIDTYWSGVHISFSMYRGYSLKTNSDVIVGDKTITKGSQFYQGIESLATGYLFRFNSYVDFTPYIGFAYTETQHDDGNLKSLYCLQAGFKSDFVIETHEESEIFLGGNILLRFEVGILFNEYRKIRNDLGKNSLYATIGVMFGAFRKYFDYSF